MRSLDPAEVELFTSPSFRTRDADERIFDEDPAPAIRNPLDDAPELDIFAAPAWEAYQFILDWSDGMGGLDVDALERFFEAPNAGADLESEARNLVRKLIPVLIREDRRIQREDRERRRTA